MDADVEVSGTLQQIGVNFWAVFNADEPQKCIDFISAFAQSCDIDGVPNGIYINTIGYEIVCNISKRVPGIYFN